MVYIPKYLTQREPKYDEICIISKIYGYLQFVKILNSNSYWLLNYNKKQNLFVEDLRGSENITVSPLFFVIFTFIK